MTFGVSPSPDSLTNCPTTHKSFLHDVLWQHTVLLACQSILLEKYFKPCPFILERKHVC